VDNCPQTRQIKIIKIYVLDSFALIMFFEDGFGAEKALRHCRRLYYGYSKPDFILNTGGALNVYPGRRKPRL